MCGTGSTRDMPAAGFVRQGAGAVGGWSASRLATLRAAVVGGYPAGGLFLSWSIVVKSVRILFVGVIVMFGGLIFGGGVGLLRKELSPPMHGTWLGVP
jgi:hypothetical protein